MTGTAAAFGLALLATAQAAPPIVDPPPVATVVDLQLDAVQRMTVDVRVNARGPFAFMVDTGASRTVISRELATALALPSAGSALLRDIAGASIVETAHVAKLEVAQVERTALVAPLLDATHLGARGVLGIDALAGTQVLMDFERRQMTVARRSRAPRDEPGTIVVVARRRAGQLIVLDAAVDGVAVRMIVDSGAQSSIGNIALMKRLERRRRRAGQPTTLLSVTGRAVAAQAIDVDDLRIARLHLDRVSISFAALDTFRHFGLEDRPAMLLGMDVLRAFRRVSLDFATRRIRFLPPEG